MTFSEAVYNTNGGSGALEASDFVFSITGRYGHAYRVQLPSSIDISGNVYTLGIGVNWFNPDGDEVRS